MSFADLAYAVGPVAGPLLAGLGCLMVVSWTSRRNLVIAACVLGFIVLASWRIHWLTWGVAFEASDAAREPHPLVRSTVNGASDVCTLATAALVAVAVWVRTRAGWQATARYAEAAAAAETRR